MDDEAWLESVCRTLCMNKGMSPDNWQTMKPSVVQVIEASRQAGAVVVPTVGEVE